MARRTKVLALASEHHWAFCSTGPSMLINILVPPLPTSPGVNLWVVLEERRKKTGSSTGGPLYGRMHYSRSYPGIRPRVSGVA